MNKVLVTTELGAGDIALIVARGSLEKQHQKIYSIVNVERGPVALPPKKHRGVPKEQQDLKNKTLILCHLIDSNPQVEITAHQITSLTKKLYKGLEE